RRFPALLRLWKNPFTASEGTSGSSIGIWNYLDWGCLVMMTIICSQLDHPRLSPLHQLLNSRAASQAQTIGSIRGLSAHSITTPSTRVPISLTAHPLQNIKRATVSAPDSKCWHAPTSRLSANIDTPLDHRTRIR